MAKIKHLLLLCIFFQTHNAFSQISILEMNKKTFNKFEVTNLAGDGLITSYEKSHVINEYNSSHEHPLIYIATNSHTSYFYGDDVFRGWGGFLFWGDEFKDEVDYDSDLYFVYNYLEKLDETADTGGVFHGFNYPTHAINPPGNSKIWLGFRGQVGNNTNMSLLGVLSPHVPAKGGISHEWLSFSISHTFHGFGNTPTALKNITWVPWDWWKQ